MNGNAELLNFVYQNTQMGINTIEQLLEIVEEDAMREQINKQLSGYQDFCREAKEMLNKNGYDEKGIGAFNKIKTYFMINMQTMTDKSASHIAEMMIIGSNMGIIEAIKNINQYKDAEKEIVKLMEHLKKFEEDNVERLKAYL